ncbi:MAG: TetR/AcrR family transcriptional regulator [Anaerolineales bacterium]|nr:TetR/AcrR family transcriptional regulator [Anaerolineales bacterium]
MEQGINKTSLNEVAYHAGVSRATIYRYFKDKQSLVRAVFLSVEQIFIDGLQEFRLKRPSTIEITMQSIGRKLEALPAGDVFRREDELKRTYPDISDEIQALRESNLNRLFIEIRNIGREQGLFREDLNEALIKAIFWELTFHFFDNPRFKSLGFSDADLYYQVSRIILYGIMKQEAGSS